MLIDMLMNIEPAARVFTIERACCPGLRDVWRKMEDRYDLHVEVVDATRRTARGRRRLLRSAQGGGAALGARRRGRLDHRHPPRAVPTRANAEKDEWTETRGVRKFNPWWTGRRPTCGASARARPAVPPVHDQGTTRSLAPPAPFPVTAVTGAGPGRRRRSVGCTWSTREASVSTPSRDADPIGLRDLPPPAPRVGGHPRHPRGGRGLRGCVGALPGGKDPPCCSTWSARLTTPALPFPVMHVDTGTTSPR